MSFFIKFFNVQYTNFNYKVGVVGVLKTMCMHIDVLVQIKFTMSLSETTILYAQMEYHNILEKGFVIFFEIFI